IERSKNLERLFEAFSQLDMPNLQLVVSGKKSNYWQEIVSKIEELGLGAKVIMTGYVKDKDLVSLINGSEFVIFPTLYEGAGLPGIEAMACGKAVAASSVPAVKEYCGKAALYFNPYKVHEIVRAIKAFLDDPIIKRDFAQKGLLRSKEFVWKNHAVKTQKVWESVS
ncbi:MAG: glycosyltransferase family 1 protein, partial [Patescibacteria group bacterium]|nr:glycosyltransferase family 1 protein [Patescibacteria group bacterium]